ncbi:hypothetical protein HY772_01520 [Candidatus Woesearchaeota archaeon]|nr:hypothetical protein [Candidatus Woesearchaeota archaeon]
MTPDTTYIVTDCMDVDGLFSAVILNRALQASGTRIVNLPTRVADLTTRYTKLFTGDQQPGRVIVADLAHNTSINSLEGLLANATHRGFSIEVYDEHAFQVDGPTRQYFSTVHIEDGKASAKIVQEVFAPQDAISAAYAHLAQLADFPPPQAHPLESILDDLADLIVGIRHVNTKITFCDLIAHYAKETSLLTPEFQTICFKYRLKKADAELRTRGSVVVYYLFKKSDRVPLAIGYAESILYMKPGIRAVHEQGSTPFAAAVFDDGKIVFSARHSQEPQNTALAAVDCSVLGKTYNGGGRFDGGGGSIPDENVSQEKFNDVALALKEKVKRLFDLNE